MTSLVGSNVSAQGFFRLHPELRNAIYEYVLADIGDNVIVDLENGGGVNRKHGTKAKRQKNPNGDASPLSILLTCKQINNEATGLAYSKLSLRVGDVFETQENGLSMPIEQGRAVVKDLLETFAQDFRTKTLSHITKTHFRQCHTMIVLGFYHNLDFVPLEHPGCTENCHKYAQFGSIVHEAFHNIRSITVDLDSSLDYGINLLRNGTSWLSLVIEPIHVPRLLRNFSNLEEIVVRRESGEQQISYLCEYKIFASGSGVPLWGFHDLA